MSIGRAPEEKKILIIDDDENLRELLRDILSDYPNYQIKEARNGVEGLSTYNANPFDLVITDILMPDMDGIEMIIQMRRICPQAKIIAISGGGRARHLDFLKIAIKAGALRILPKPFTPEKLAEVVNELLGQSPERLIS